MRLTPDQCHLILATVRRHISGSHRVLLYGSRLDDQARGGDVDLLIESDAAVPILQRARIKNELEDRLHLPIDLIAIQPGHAASPFQTIALAQAVPLDSLRHGH
ncbi:MAG: nucleotidyltransferase domain-containing protein [Pseudomonadota bacterium]|nr:nucleotidyltransferase domain-containing protein [Pseudomonadota bacterium]MDP1903369.1 nucleotidyltransferase domain-containing protein [Pseudomonadota bacterium]MDP2352339.1 nucleotidyltransferase domain-containing protein [Pseudomonadota bacterium]